jgi:hypothetical protein
MCRDGGGDDASPFLPGDFDLRENNPDNPRRDSNTGLLVSDVTLPNGDTGGFDVSSSTADEDDESSFVTISGIFDEPLLVRTMCINDPVLIGRDDGVEDVDDPEVVLC